MIEPLVQRAPIFWSRVRLERPALRSEVGAVLTNAGVEVRYVASSVRPSAALPPMLKTRGAPRAAPTAWQARTPFAFEDDDTEGRWFLRAKAGVGVDRARFGSGAGTRIAVVEDDAGGTDQLELDAEIPINLIRVPRGMLHGATLVALAVSARRFAERDVRFIGVAPHASPRLYCIPKPGLDVVSLPLAIVRAVDDGADVVVCATYIEGTSSPMLDDALAFASRLGRRGRGSAVVLPVGRETSSPSGSVHASLALSFRDPASDPRAFCIGPSGKEGGWFFWRDRKGQLRPFGNRGPACRWLAPGDDLTFPFVFEDRWGHSESSGASAIAAGVLLLVLSANPELRLEELHEIITKTAVPAESAPSFDQLADPHDVMPPGTDPDGHNAKHGYGRMHAGRASMSAADPIAHVLVAIGEESAAGAYLACRSGRAELKGAYSARLARWAVRAIMRNKLALHAASAFCRHVRLLVPDARRQESHGRGALARQLALLLRLLSDGRGMPVPAPLVARELATLASALEECLRSPERQTLLDARLYDIAVDVWGERNARGG
jgi:hypothetical protein